MTLLIGIRCTDGVIVGADTLATLGFAGTQTVVEPTSKITVLGKKRILALTGPVGLAQRYAEALSAISDSSIKALKPMQVAQQISAKFWAHAETEYKRAQIVAQSIGNTAPIANAMHASLVAITCGGKDRLFQFTETCAPEEVTEDLPYVSLGSGQANADPFLSFLRRVFWQDRPPSYAEGLFVALWALNQTTEATPGIGGEPQLAVLQSGVARVLTSDEVTEHIESIASAEKALSGWRTEVSAATESTGTEPPKPKG